MPYAMHWTPWGPPSPPPLSAAWPMCAPRHSRPRWVDFFLCIELFMCMDWCIDPFQLCCQHVVYGTAGACLGCHVKGAGASPSTFKAGVVANPQAGRPNCCSACHSHDHP